MKTYDPSKTPAAPHDTARALVKGEAPFIDDRPHTQGEVLVGLFLSSKAHARIKKTQIKEALAMPGILGIWGGDDLAHNIWGSIIHDQPLLANRLVSYLGEPIFLIAGLSKAEIEAAKAKIIVEYQELPAIFSIEEAIEKKSFIGPKRTIERGTAEKILKKAKHRLEGSFDCGGQDHFYLESQAALAYPEELDRVVVHSSTQHPTEVQHVLAHALNLQYHQVVCVVARMGGGFGGKESQAAPFGAYAGIVAHKLKRPARLVLTKDEDMLITGKRHPFKFFYDLCYSPSGAFEALSIDIYSDGGAYADLSTSIMERCMLHVDNAYYIPHIKINGQVCKTHFQSNTAFRGFGGPQGVAFIEHLIEELALLVGRDPLELRKKNCYGISLRNRTPYGQKLTNNTLPEIFKKLEKSSDYKKRRREIGSYNQKSRTHLRGLSLTAVKFGISFTTTFLNQGNALVQVHRDGSVQVSTGATEMGQGVNTKIAQVVAQCFDIPLDWVRVMPTSTEKNANTSPTAASSGSDINARAAFEAASRIQARLKKIRRKNMSFAQVVNQAYLSRVSLGEYAYFKTPDIFFDKEKGQGTPFFYFTNGAAVSEVLIDRLTGELKVLRTDILMDLGRPINTHVDWGQTLGAFIQGQGWVTTEKLFWNEEGKLLTHSPTTYKIPNIQDIPRDFRVNFLDNPHNQKNILGSKAVGEPPLLLGASIFCAVKNALSYAQAGAHLKIPATAEEILMNLSRYQS